MSKIGSWLSLSLVGMACLALNALPAHAQNNRSWVSHAGIVGSVKPDQHVFIGPTGHACQDLVQ